MTRIEYQQVPYMVASLPSLVDILVIWRLMNAHIVITYNALENVNESLKFDLLQKTAYFADKEPVLTDEHANTYGLYQDSPMPWKEGGFAEKLARDLKDQIAAKCALLYGFSRHGRYEDCILMFEELKGCQLCFQKRIGEQTEDWSYFCGEI
ncbi:unnamed protein product [Lepeophtheirus salmonis]|uniref:(salmon louse) hypothetical protein n=1 Tax=Lepeophtheirus salmonis TaxID=72036 RepID=A0A7R8CLB6_LEPSM|nr:unnamed protein product [Lepeophtheirus salmonis]CAF2855240.1 unnamed protein product [Lepeophtheirus salmonis]